MRFHLFLTTLALTLSPQTLPSWGRPSGPSDILQPRAVKATEDAYGDPSYTGPKANLSTPLDQLPDARPPQDKRRFISRLVEAELARLSSKIADPALRRILNNTFPNTLDTTIAWTDLQLDAEPDHARAFPRAVAITGDIEAMWLRDSQRQINPYLDLLAAPPAGFEVGDKDWVKLYRLALGLLYVQAQYVLTDPFANSFGPPNGAYMLKEKKTNPAMNESDPNADWFYPPPPGLKSYYAPHPNKTQSRVEGTDGAYVWEQKWEVDSLASFFTLAARLAAVSNRTDFVHKPIWQRAAGMAICALRSQQRSTGDEHLANEAALATAHDSSSTRSKRAADTDAEGASNASSSSFDYTAEWNRRFASLGGGVYRFQRQDRSATETRADHGFGEPGRRVGLVKSAFRPSDDATVLPFLVPSNAALAVALEGVVPLIRTQSLNGTLDALADDAEGLAREIRTAISEEAVLMRAGSAGKKDGGSVFAYEVDGYGGSYFMDDANVPSLLSLPYLGYVDGSDEVYQRTRSLVLSPENKWFFNGTVGYGIGGPHVGTPYIWPMSRLMEGLTSNDSRVHYDVLAFLRNTTAGTGLMHESINARTNASDFTRPWFGWANGLVGELIRHIDDVNGTFLEQAVF
ncbi:hypothetical protein OC834_003128 [Tilletia horrida]|nr:hypothetical protein OC834_003128 [Tilletia horrida]